MTELTADFELTEAPEQRLSPPSALFGVLFRPRHTFTVMREAAVGHWWIVLILLVIGTIAFGAAMLPVQIEMTAVELGQFDTSDEELTAEQRQGIEQAQAMDPSQLGTLSTGLIVAGLLVGSLFGYLIRAALLFAVGLALGGRASFRQIFRMGVWTTLPEVIRIYVGALVMFMTGDLVSSGVSNIYTGSEMREVSPVLLAFLQNIDVYTIWSLVLIGIGVAVTYQVRPGKAAVITLIYWVIGIIFLLGFAALGGAFSGAVGGGAG